MNPGGLGSRIDCAVDVSWKAKYLHGVAGFPAPHLFGGRPFQFGS